MELVMTFHFSDFYPAKLHEKKMRRWERENQIEQTEYSTCPSLASL